MLWCLYQGQDHGEAARLAEGDSVRLQREELRGAERRSDVQSFKLSLAAKQNLSLQPEKWENVPFLEFGSFATYISSMFFHFLFSFCEDFSTWRKEQIAEQLPDPEEEGVGLSMYLATWRVVASF